MALETKLYHKLSQQLVMTPQLQQAIKMLQLSRLDLIEAIREELEENPVLEEDLDSKEEAEEVKEANVSEEDWDSFLSRSDFDRPSNYSKGRDENVTFESFTPQKTTLSDHLLWQLRLSEIEGNKRDIGEAIIGNINDDGYLEAGVEEIAAFLGSSQEEVGGVLRLIQDFDPPGVGARDLRECLLIQVRTLGMKDSLVERIIMDHLSLLEKKDYKGLAKILAVSVDDVLAAGRIISGLEPKPGRPFQQEPAIYIVPDVYVFKVGGDYVVLSNEEGVPRLKLSEFYKDSVRGMAKGGESRDYIQDKMRTGTWFIKSIQQRQRTICKVTESIVKFQREFLEKGIRYLKPLILRDIAEDVGMHESTISRVTTNKYVHTPQGIYELKFFFGSGVASSNGETAAAESVKDMIKKMIEGEDHCKPYSDEAIAELLKRSGIEIARRTVTKYREAMRIPSSTRRGRGY